MFRALRCNCGLILTSLTCDPFGTDLWKQNKEAALQLKDTPKRSQTHRVSHFDKRQYSGFSVTPRY